MSPELIELLKILGLSPVSILVLFGLGFIARYLFKAYVLAEKLLARVDLLTDWYAKEHKMTLHEVHTLATARISTPKSKTNGKVC